MMKSLVSALSLLSVGLTTVSAQTISAFVSQDADFSKLYSALQATGLDETLSGEGPFTVFAPSNQAFEALESYSPGTFDKLLAETQSPVLTDILLYHVVNGLVTQEDINGGLTSAETAQGENVTLSASTSFSPMLVDDFAEIVKSNITLDNGVIHVISAALVPNSVPLVPSILIAANSTGQFHVLFDLIMDGGLGSQLNSASDLTVFAPTDDAFAKIPNLDELVSDPQAIMAILMNHVVVGLNTADTLTDGRVLTTLGQKELLVSIVNDTVMIGDAAVVQADILGSNGVVHAIDTILFRDLLLSSDGNFTMSAPTQAPTSLFGPNNQDPTVQGTESDSSSVRASFGKFVVASVALFFALL